MRNGLNLPLVAPVCGRKTRHYSVEEARNALRELKAREHVQGGRPGSLRIYHCPVCQAFHVGHQRPPNRGR